jgi:hypothetical protein
MNANPVALLATMLKSSLSRSTARISKGFCRRAIVRGQVPVLSVTRYHSGVWDKSEPWFVQAQDAKSAAVRSLRVSQNLGCFAPKSGRRPIRL